MDVPIYEIYALKYAGPLARPVPMMYWFHDMDKMIQINDCCGLRLYARIGR